jgi:hypothetical protein
MLDGLLLLSTAAFILAGVVVGARLLRLAARTRELPDFVVGLAVFESAGVAYPLILLSSLGAAGSLSFEVTKVVSALSTFAVALGWTCVYLFTQRVFRPGEKWAIALACGGAGIMWYGVVAGARFVLAAPDLATLASTSENPTIWIQVGGFLVFTWTALEGLRCWEQARRRRALGLADPLVVNRFLLWSLFGATALLCIVPSLAMTVAGVEGAVASPTSRWCVAVGGFGGAVALQLGFLPPARYRAWIMRAA